MNKMLFLALFALFAALATGAADATYSFISVQSPLVGEYDFMTEQPIEGTVDVGISGMKAGESYPYFIAFDHGPGQAYLTGPNASWRLPYTVYSSPVAPRTELKSAAEATSTTQVLTGLFARATAGSSETASATHRFAIVPTPGVYLPAGIYEGRITEGYYHTEFPKMGAHSFRDLTIRVTVPTSTELSLVELGGAFDPATTSAVLDFGQLVEGTRKSLDLLARSNATYSIAISSRHAGQLKQSPEQTAGVPYTLTFGGKRLDLGTGVPVAAVDNAPWTAGNASRYRIEIIIGAHGALASGFYSDIVTFTISGS